MKFKNVLLLYKRSAYRIYFQEKHSSLRGKKMDVLKNEITRFQNSHAEHYETLKNVARILFTHGIQFDENYRGRTIDYKKYDLIITVGGDGTFLEAARNIKNQVMIGINSAPSYSVGRFCIANLSNFENILQQIINNQFSIKEYQRLHLNLKSETSHETADVLNDILVCNTNPAALSRYYIQIGKWREEQRSSGVWISTPAGSTGAIGSAGGQKLDPYFKKFQYLPRELYAGIQTPYKLRGGVLTPRQNIKITSLNRRGIVYIDGAHVKFPFEYGSELTVSLSPHPIKTIEVKV